MLSDDCICTWNKAVDGRSKGTNKQPTLKNNCNKTRVKWTTPLRLLTYLQAFCARPVPRPPPSGSPRSEHGTSWPAHCPAAPATPPDSTPPWTSRSDCCRCPPGTSAEHKQRLNQSSHLFLGLRGKPDPQSSTRTSCTSVVVLIMRTLFSEPHHSFPPTGTILVTGLLGVPRTKVWEDWGSQKLPADLDWKMI